MVVKKTAEKKEAPEATPSWDQIGKMVGKKVEAEKEGWKGSCCPPWWHQKRDKGGNFFGALLFGIIFAVILNQQEILLHQVSWWLQVLLVFGWALMWS